MNGRKNKGDVLLRLKLMCMHVMLNCPALAKRAEAGVARLKKGSAPNS